MKTLFVSKIASKNCYCVGETIQRYEHKGAGLLTALSNTTNNDNIVLIGAKDQVILWDVRTESKTWRSARSSMGQVCLEKFCLAAAYIYYSIKICIQIGTRYFIHK